MILMRLLTMAETPITRLVIIGAMMEDAQILDDAGASAGREPARRARQLVQGLRLASGWTARHGESNQGTLALALCCLPWRQTRCVWFAPFFVCESVSRCSEHL